MIRRWVVSCLSITIAVASAANAQPAAPDRHRRAAEELLEVMHVERSVNDAIDIMVKAQLQANPQLGQFEDVLRAFLAKYISWDAIRGDYAQLYMDTFSEEEIRQMMSFYRTPAGQKLISSLPQIMRRGADIGQAKVADHLEELKEQVGKRVLELQKTKETP